MTTSGLERLPMKPGLIVSCQAFPGEPLYGAGLMARMAKAAASGGAVAIRANGTDDIRSIKAAVPLPVIGLLKREIPGSAIYITPELEDVEAVLAAGADIVALDATNREGRLARIVPLLERIRRAGALAMADVSTEEEGLAAERLGFDIVSTTLSGYTPYSPQTKQPDLELVRRLSARLNVPLAAEGRIFRTEEAEAAIEAGAMFVVVGGAITRPQLIAQRFAEAVGSRLTAKPAVAGSRCGESGGGSGEGGGSGGVGGSDGVGAGGRSGGSVGSGGSDEGGRSGGSGESGGVGVGGRGGGSGEDGRSGGSVGSGGVGEGGRGVGSGESGESSESSGSAAREGAGS